MKINVYKYPKAPELTTVYFNDVRVSNYDLYGNSNKVKVLDFLNSLHPSNILYLIYMNENPVELIRRSMKENNFNKILLIKINNKTFKMQNTGANCRAFFKWCVKHNYDTFKTEIITLGGKK